MHPRLVRCISCDAMIEGKFPILECPNCHKKSPVVTYEVVIVKQEKAI